MLATNVCKHEEIKTVPLNTLKNFILLTFSGFVILFIYKKEKKKKAMGTPIAANHVNLSMDMFGRSLLNDLDKKNVKKKI